MRDLHEILPQYTKIPYTFWKQNNQKNTFFAKLKWRPDKIQCKKTMGENDDWLVLKIFGNTAQKIKFFIKDFFSKCDQIHTADMVAFTEEIFNGHLLKKSLMENLIFLCSATYEM